MNLLHIPKEMLDSSIGSMSPHYLWIAISLRSWQ